MSGFDIERVLELLPHRYPFLLVDRVIEFEQNKRLVAIKNVTYNEPFFTGHFPTKPVMPGVLIVEAMAQATGLLAMESTPEYDGGLLYYLVGVDKARFRQPVGPGDQVVLIANLKSTKRSMWRFECEARVGDKLVASADIMCTARES